MKKDTVTPFSKKHIVLRFIIVFSVQILAFYRDYLLDINLPNSNAFYFLSDLFYWLIIWVGCCMLFVEELVHRYDSYLLILSIQELYKSIDFGERRKNFVIWNWISVLMIFIFDVLVTIIFYANYQRFDVVNLISDCLVIKFDMVFFHSYRMLALLTMYLEEWTKCVQTLNNEFNEEINEFRCKKLLKSYDNILKSYELFKKVFQISALFYIMDSFGRTMLYTKILLGLIDLKKESVVIAIIMSYIWFLKNFLMSTVYNIQYEKFYIKIKDAQSASIQLRTCSNCSKSVKLFSKKVLQRHRTFSKMTACGLFYIDAMLPIRLLLLTTNYVIVLLQFAFL
ncbi:hypothetical protein SFRURICE_016979 [Spodoptera frugiperda]|nr:hypothetical protein SFRURICE_016979 [Spodoptera frugiperda]